MAKKIKKQVGGIIPPRVGGNIAGAASPLGGGALPGTRMFKKGGKIKAKRGGSVKKK